MVYHIPLPKVHWYNIDILIDLNRLIVLEFDIRVAYLSGYVLL